ncbi:DUF4230 domain-containing protein, partial [Candidatus Bipolaricaulota bacterium]|nr:DUF4230 domain-containing protein [Candidatus Bipolaricaulota bacterium]
WTIPVVIVIAVLVVGLGVALLALRRARRVRSSISIHSTMQHMRSIGHLSVFKVFTKEIVTQNDHSWGEFGAKYLSWAISGRKMAMIFEFEIDFRYDLRRPEFEIRESPEGGYAIAMPPCLHEVHIRNIRFYDEQGSRFLPWLLPDLVSSFVGGRFTETDKNRLVAAARDHAEQQASDLIGSLQSEVQNSAKATLQSISKAFGAEDVTFEFAPQGRLDFTVDVAEKVVAG